MSAASTDLLVVIGDTHIGHRSSLCPPRGFTIDGGSLILPNEIQKAICEAYGRFVEMVRAATVGKSYTLIHLGDIVEGNHHGAIDTLSLNIKDQEDNAFDTLQDLFAGAAERYCVRGTPAHAGPDSVFEEPIAQRLGAIPTVSTVSGRESYTRHVVCIEWNGYLIHAAHHVSATGVAGSRTTGPMKEIVGLRESAAAFGRRAPDIILRGHCHTGAIAGDVTRYGMGFGITHPGWMGKNGYVYKLPGGRASQLVVGGGIHEYRTGRFLPWIQGYPIMPDLPEAENEG